jgi:hypothetical protein
LIVIAVILILALVLGGVGALDDVANVIVQILRVVFDLLVRLIKPVRRSAQEHRISL